MTLALRLLALIWQRMTPKPSERAGGSNWLTTAALHSWRSPKNRY